MKGFVPLGVLSAYTVRRLWVDTTSTSKQLGRLTAFFVCITILPILPFLPPFRDYRASFATNGAAYIYASPLCSFLVVLSLSSGFRYALAAVRTSKSRLAATSVGCVISLGFVHWLVVLWVGASPVPFTAVLSTPVMLLQTTILYLGIPVRTRSIHQVRRQVRVAIVIVLCQMGVWWALVCLRHLFSVLDILGQSLLLLFFPMLSSAGGSVLFSVASHCGRSDRALIFAFWFTAVLHLARTLLFLHAKSVRIMFGVVLATDLATTSLSFLQLHGLGTSLLWAALRRTCACGGSVGDGSGRRRLLSARRPLAPDQRLRVAMAVAATASAPAAAAAAATAAAASCQQQQQEQGQGQQQRQAPLQRVASNAALFIRRHSPSIARSATRKKARKRRRRGSHQRRQSSNSSGGGGSSSADGEESVMASAAAFIRRHSPGTSNPQRGRKRGRGGGASGGGGGSVSGGGGGVKEDEDEEEWLFQSVATAGLPPASPTPHTSGGQSGGGFSTTASRSIGRGHSGRPGRGQSSSGSGSGSRSIREAASSAAQFIRRHSPSAATAGSAEQQRKKRHARKRHTQGHTQGHAHGHGHGHGHGAHSSATARAPAHARHSHHKGHKRRSHAGNGNGSGSGGGSGGGGDGGGDEGSGHTLAMRMARREEKQQRRQQRQTQRSEAAAAAAAEAAAAEAAEAEAAEACSSLFDDVDGDFEMDSAAAVAAAASVGESAADADATARPDGSNSARSSFAEVEDTTTTAHSGGGDCAASGGDTTTASGTHKRHHHHRHRHRRQSAPTAAGGEEAEAGAETTAPSVPAAAAAGLECKQEGQRVSPTQQGAPGEQDSGAEGGKGDRVAGEKVEEVEGGGNLGQASHHHPYFHHRLPPTASPSTALCCLRLLGGGQQLDEEWVTRHHWGQGSPQLAAADPILRRQLFLLSQLFLRHFVEITAPLQCLAYFCLAFYGYNRSAFIGFGDGDGSDGFADDRPFHAQHLTRIALALVASAALKALLMALLCCKAKRQLGLPVLRLGYHLLHWHFWTAAILISGSCTAVLLSLWRHAGFDFSFQFLWLASRPPSP